MPHDLSHDFASSPEPSTPAVTQPDQRAGVGTSSPGDRGSILTPIARAVAAFVVRRWWAVIALAVLVSPAVWPVVRPLAVRQSVAIQLADVAVGTGGLLARWDGGAEAARVVPRGRHEVFEAELALPGWVESVELRGPTARGRVAGASVTTRVFGIDAGTRPVRSIESATITPEGGATLAWMRWGGAIGVLTLAGLGGVLGVGGVLACVVARRGASVRGVTIAAWAVVLAAHAWMWLMAPMLMTKDGIAYVAIARDLIGGGGLSALEPIRPAGMAFWLAPLVAIDLPFRWTIGSANLALAVVVVWCAWRIARVAAGPAAAAAAIVLVGLDPFLLGFARTPGSEVPAAACAGVAAWLVAVRPWGQCALRDAGLAVVLGLVVGFAALLRANLQVLMVLMPICVAWRAFFGARDRFGFQLACVRAASVFAIALCVGVASILPVVLHNGRTHGGYALSLFGNTTKFTSLLQCGVIEPSDAGPLSAEDYVQVRDGLAGNAVAFRYRMLEIAGAGEGIMEIERVAGEVVDRAHERDPAGIAAVQGGALAVHLGVLPAQRVMRTSHSWSVLRPLARQPWRGSSTNFMDEDIARRQLGDKLARVNREPIRPWRQSVSSELFVGLWNGWSVLRPVVGVLALVGGVCLLVRGREGPALVLGVALAHACALAIVAYTPIERYQFPVWPIVVAASLACFAARRGR